MIFSDQYDLSVLKGPENGTKEVRYDSISIVIIVLSTSEIFKVNISCYLSRQDRIRITKDLFELNIIELAFLFQAATFRKLWTERSELRRFPDGSILESVVWNVETAKDKRLIWMDATRYLLEM